MSIESFHGGLHPVEEIAKRLHAVRRVGIRPARLLPCLDLLELIGAAEQSIDDPYTRAIVLANHLSEAASSLGDGPTGRAIQALFGITNETRGRPLKDRRRLAAEELDLMPSTFRRYYEDDLIEDLALELWRANA